MAPWETENNANAKLWDDNKEHYGMLWYFLGWSITDVLVLALVPTTDTNSVIFVANEALLWGPLLKRGYSSFSAKGDTVKIVSHKC